MDPLDKFLAIVFSVLVLSVVGGIAGSVSYSKYLDNQVKLELAKQGADPVAISCAFDGMGDNPVCVIKASK